MTPIETAPLPKKYYRVVELAKHWNRDVSELLNYAIEGILQVNIEEFHGFNPDDNSEVAASSHWEFGCYPYWAIFLVPEALKKIAQNGSVSISGGFRMTPMGLELVSFPQRQISATDLIILPKTLDEMPISTVEGDKGVESPISPASRKTLLKQIAAMAILLSKQQGKYSWGDKPNSSKIANELEIVISELSAKYSINFDQMFFSKTKINDSIREGLALIGLKSEKDSTK